MTDTRDLEARLRASSDCGGEFKWSYLAGVMSDALAALTAQREEIERLEQKLDSIDLAARLSIAELEAQLAEALEDAAKIAEGHFIPGHSIAGPAFAMVCAAKNRAQAEGRR